MPLLCCDVQLVSELCLTAGCVLMDLASPAVSGTSVYANGLNASGVDLSKGGGFKELQQFQEYISVNKIIVYSGLSPDRLV